jgi:hypothetical protein
LRGINTTAFHFFSPLPVFDPLINNHDEETLFCLYPSKNLEFRGTRNLFDGSQEWNTVDCSKIRLFIAVESE